MIIGLKLSIAASSRPSASSVPPHMPGPYHTHFRFPCGGSETFVNATTLYCPAGSREPLLVGLGNYSTGSPTDAPHQRTGQAVCEPGRFCVKGVAVREAA